MHANLFSSTHCRLLIEEEFLLPSLLLQEWVLLAPVPHASLSVKEADWLWNTVNLRLLENIENYLRFGEKDELGFIVEI